MKHILTLITLTLITINLKAQKDTSFSRTFQAVTTALFPDASSDDTHEIHQSITLKLIPHFMIVRRVPNSSFLGGVDSLHVLKVTYSKKTSVLKITTVEKVTFTCYHDFILMRYVTVKKKYRMDLFEIKDEIRPRVL